MGHTWRIQSEYRMCGSAVGFKDGGLLSNVRDTHSDQWSLSCFYGLEVKS